MEQCPTGQSCKCPHHVMAPVFIVLLGLAFLLKAMGVISEGLTGYIWPILLILMGLQKIMSKACKCCCNK